MGGGYLMRMRGGSAVDAPGGALLESTPGARCTLQTGVTWMILLLLLVLPSLSLMKELLWTPHKRSYLLLPFRSASGLCLRVVSPSGPYKRPPFINPYKRKREI